MLISKQKLGVFAMSIAISGSLLFSGCATRGYARRQARDVDNKVTALASVVQEQGERLDATDARARQGIADASSARSAAAAAQATANQANATAQAAMNAASSAQSGADTTLIAQRAANLENRVSALEAGGGGTGNAFYPGPITTVIFKTGRWDLSKEAQRALDNIAVPLTDPNSAYRVEVQGYASSEGQEMKNINLSQQRSESVQRYLVSKGANVVNINTVGLGTQNPIGDNSTKSGRQMNRRAEIRVFPTTK